MTSTDFLLRYASVTTSLFDHIEHDMLDLSSAFIDDDDPAPILLHDPVLLHAPLPLDIPLS
ncbi:hypothetical protein [Massilia yuzhufengensis]|uniref:Uncharacterized protein n=1 Tax=Massilia yuzhufengensis TaxID=1164594 RepID=A0A1I1NDL5_9BURK|nr:hypothetical protein [Massilia yuzhufengensis]SFC95719.1 hypothetical protein SAMN05216204_11341 [Massilia yuzhufengensis]